MNQASDKNRSVIIWLIFLILMVFAMVFIGGITRLTDSGLSMVDWKPIVGAIPPLNQQEWQQAFLKYQAFPEYQKINFDMTLSEFKSIYFWEYFHRLFGRLIGLAFFFPFVYFLMKKKLDRALSRKVFVAFVLGGMQGLMGWYMVKSGLVNRPDVSQYRLCAHLSLAFLIIGYIYYIILSLRNPERIRVLSKPGFKLLILFFIILIFQIGYGALVAGLDAGLTYNSFPLMGRQWTPKDMFYLSPVYLNFFENTGTVQFMHRTLGWILAILSIAIFFKNKGITDTKQRKATNYVVAMVFIQFLLGVGTIIMAVPIALASIHQLGAVVLFLLSINALYFTLTNSK